MASAAHDLWALYSPRSIPAIHNKLRLLDNVFVVVIGMVRYDYDAVVLSQILQF